MTDQLAAHRVAWWQYTLLDRDDREVAPLLGVQPGGKITLSAKTRLRASGTITLTDFEQDIDWNVQRVRIRYHMLSGGIEQSWGLGVFLPAAPGVDYRDGSRSMQVELTSKLQVLDEDMVENTLSVPASTVITDAVVQIIQSAGEERIAVTPSPATTSSLLVWAPGTPKLTVINDLLDAAGYWALWVDGEGQFRVEPYVSPAQRSIAWRFAEGEAAIHLPEWTLDQDIASVPNKVILVSQGSGEEEALVSVALNENPDSPYGYQARGRWITHAEDGVEAADQSVLDTLAQRKLLDLSSPSATISAQHMPIPIDPNAVVSWNSQGHATLRAVVQEITYALDAKSLCSSQFLEVTS